MTPPTLHDVYAARERVTPHTEAFQAVVWHLFVTHPALKAAATKWESTATADATKKAA